MHRSLHEPIVVLHVREEARAKLKLLAAHQRKPMYQVFDELVSQAIREWEDKAYPSAPAGGTLSAVEYSHRSCRAWIEPLHAK